MLSLEKVSTMNSILKYELQSADFIDVEHPSSKIEILVNALRLVSNDPDIKVRKLFIPDECEKYGFAKGKHNLGVLLHFLADMLEE